MWLQPLRYLSGLKPSAQQRLYAGLESSSTLWQMIAPPGSSFKLTTTIG
jgi:hypothetical protein